MRKVVTSANVQLSSSGGVAIFPYTVQVYLGWMPRFRAYCLRRHLIEADELSLIAVRRFIGSHAGPRPERKALTPRTSASAQNAIRAWACALQSLGEKLPAWDSSPKNLALPPLLNPYCEYRLAHNGVAEGTLVRDLDVAQRFHQHLRDRQRTIRTPRPVDLDTFVHELRSRTSARTVADHCSSLRSFLRFLQAQDEWMRTSQRVLLRRAFANRQGRRGYWPGTT